MSGFGISGLGSGIDFSLYIDAILKADTDKLINTVGKQEFNAQSEQVVFNNVKASLQGLNTLIKDFKFAQDFKKKTVSSSDPDVFTGTATLSALVQSVKIQVNSLANNEISRMSFSGVSDVVHSGADTTITINVRGEDKTLDVPSGTTLSGLANIINSAKIGITANVYDSGDGTATPARLSITDNKLGDYDGDGGTANINFTAFSANLDGVGADPTVSEAAVNTEVIIAGETITTSSHTVTGVLPGVTLNLISADPGVEKVLTVQESSGDAAKKIRALVDKYSEVVSLIRQAVRFDPNLEQQTNPTAGNSTLRNVLTRLQGAITGQLYTLPNDVEFRSLTDFGVTSQFDAAGGGTNGLLSFDESKFNAKLADNYEDVIAFFEGLTEDSVEYKGFADTFMDVMDSFLGTNGSITSKLTSLGSELKRLSEEKADALERLAEKEEMLTQKFARLEGQLSRLNGQQSTLNAALQSLQLNNQFIANRK